MTPEQFLVNIPAINGKESNFIEFKITYTSTIWETNFKLLNENSVNDSRYACSLTQIKIVNERIQSQNR